MQFKQFLSINEALILIESDTIEWEPASVAQYKNEPGITRDTAAGISQQKRLTTSPKVGDIVFVTTRPGQTTPTVISDIAGGEASLVNSRLNVRLKKPLGSLVIGSQAHQNQVGSKYPGRKAWMHDPNNKSDYLS